MAKGGSINFDVGFNVNKQSLESLKKELQDIQSSTAKQIAPKVGTSNAQSELNKIKKNYDNVVHEANISKQVNKKLREKIDNLTKYHNMWQTLTSENNKLKKQLKQFYIYKSHFNDGEA